MTVITPARRAIVEVHRSAGCCGAVAHRQRQLRAHPVRAARVGRDLDGQCCHERVESARRRTGLVPILGHGSRLGAEELGLLAKAERASRDVGTQRSIDIDTYDRHAEKLREELTLVRIDRHSGQLEELDVEGILAFAERVLPRAADLWVQASLEQRQRFQQLFFPDGIAFDGNRFIGTGATAPAFSYLRTNRDWK